MKTIILSCIGGLFLLAAVAVFFWNPAEYWSRTGRPTGSPAEASAARELAALTRRVAALESEKESLKDRLDKLAEEKRQAGDPSLAAVRPAAAETGPAGPEISEMPAAGTEENSASAAPGASEKENALEEALGVLTRSGEGWDEKQEVWNRLAKDGRLDEAVAFFETRANENPGNPDYQAELGHAYLQKIFTAKEIEQGLWAKKADKAYDRALSLDDHHWEARFSKAISYSFWPPVFGMQAKAIEHFEVLRAQQEAQAPEKKFAETYVYLGNLYENQGKSDKAMEIRRKGLELFPDETDLARSLRPAENK